MQPENNVPESPDQKLPTPTPVVSQASVGSAAKNKKQMLFAVIAAAVFVVLGAGAAAYFGVIAPNKPENVWKQSLQNTGKGYDKLVNYAEQKKDVKGGKITGDFKLEASGVVGDGTFESKYYDKDSESKLDVGAMGARFNLEVLTQAPDSSKNPDIYAKVSGLKGVDQLLGAAGAGAGQALAAYDNQWFVVDHTLLDQLEKSAGSSSQTAMDIKAEDAIALARDLGGVTKEYVLTDDSAKAVLKVRENVGKETKDGRSVYHYKVSINKENLKKFNKAACDKVLANKLYKALSMGKSESDLKTECYDTKDIDKINESDTFDVWVDMKTKLIRTVRITDKKNNNNHVDLGLNYNGGDDYPFAVSFETKDEAAKSSGKGEFKFTLNTKSDKVSFDFNADGQAGDGPFKVSFKGVATPSNDKVKVTKPTGAKPLQEVFGGLLGSLGSIPGAAGGGATPVPDQGLLTRCLAETTPSPECKTLLNEQ